MPTNEFEKQIWPPTNKFEKKMWPPTNEFENQIWPGTFENKVWAPRWFVFESANFSFLKSPFMHVPSESTFITAFTKTVFTMSVFFMTFCQQLQQRSPHHW
ncbi:hypothetical protein WN48_04652 [Eufriesea mexicana]|uniref:Uncharacterized protein n=1 Tax=Eufriesea mexicana TaxID=516756 RepID=A0A310SLC3_9HYME|nr:hypothetical protein WN48_04652 [Eufriesea mexicana]